MKLSFLCGLNEFPFFDNYRVGSGERNFVLHVEMYVSVKILRLYLFPRLSRDDVALASDE